MSTPDVTEDGDIIVDEETGEIIGQDVHAATELAVRATAHEVAGLPATLDELIAQYTEPDPDPVQVFTWIVGSAEMDEDEPEDSALSIMIRIMQGKTAQDILGAQEVIHAQDILGEPIRIDGVRWKKSTAGGGEGCYALLSVYRETTGTDEIVSCGAKNVMVQTLNMSARGLLPFRACITRASKATANGFYPLWLDPR